MKETIKSCLLCKNYYEHPCECAHCENHNKFKISEEGEKLYKKIFEQGYQSKNKEV